MFLKICRPIQLSRKKPEKMWELYCCTMYQVPGTKAISRGLWSTRRTHSDADSALWSRVSCYCCYYRCYCFYFFVCCCCCCCCYTYSSTNTDFSSPKTKRKYQTASYVRTAVDVLLFFCVGLCNSILLRRYHTLFFFIFLYLSAVVLLLFGLPPLCVFRIHPPTASQIWLLQVLRSPAEYHQLLVFRHRLVCVF